MSTRRSTARGAGANAAPAPAKASAVVPWETLVTGIRNTKGGNNLDLYKAISELMKHTEARVGKAPRFFAALRDEFTRRAKEADSPWIPTSAAYQSNFNKFISAHVLGADPALKTAYTALAERRVKLTLAGDNAGLAKFTTEYNKWLTEQFDRRIQEAGGPAAAAGAPAPPSPDSAASSPVMVPSSAAAESDPESGSVSGSVSGSNSEEEEEEEGDEVVAAADAISVAGASSIGSAAASDAALAEELDRLRLELSASKSKVSELEIARTRAETNASKQTVRVLAQITEIQELKKADGAKAAVLEAAAKTRANMQTQIDTLTKEAQTAASEKADLQARLDALVKSTDKEKANLQARLDAFAAGNPGDNSAIVQTLGQQIMDLTAQHDEDQARIADLVTQQETYEAQIQLLTKELNDMKANNRQTILGLEDRLRNMRIAPDDRDPGASLPPTQSHSRVPSPVNVPKQQRLEPYALYVLLAGLVSA